MPRELAAQLSFRQFYFQTAHLTTPEKLFDKRRIHNKRLFAYLVRNKDVDDLLARRHGDKGLAIDPERTIVVVRLLRHFGERHREFTDGCELQRCCAISSEETLEGVPLYWERRAT